MHPNNKQLSPNEIKSNENHQSPHTGDAVTSESAAVATRDN